MSTGFRKSAGYTTPTIFYKSGGIVSPLSGVASMNRVYSIQRVNKNYAGNIINLRRSSDSVNVDFVTDSTNTNLVTTSGAQTLSSWLGAASANVVIWYDQSGNGRNLVQTTSTLQPGYSATTGVQFRSLLYMAFPDNCTITDGTILTGFIQNAYLRGNPADQWYLQDGIIPCELPGGTNDWGLLLNGSGKFGVGTGPSDVQCSISTNGLGAYSFMTATRVSSTGAITLYNGTGSGSAFTLATGSKAGTTPSYMGYNQPGNGQYMNSDLASLFWFDDVKSGTFISSVASTFSTQIVPNLDVSGTGIVSLTGKSLFSQLPPTVVNSVAAAYSLRAVNGTTAKAVQVTKLYGVWPPIGMTSDSFTASGTYNGIVNGVYTSSASSYYVASGNEQPWRAFDKNNNGTWWTTSAGGYSVSTGLYTAGVYSTTISGSSYAGEWIQIQLPASVTVTSYTIYNSASWNSRAPVDFKIAGSNDGTNWTLVDTQTAITSWISSTTNLTFLPSTPGAYSYYRLCVNKNGGGGFLSIGEIIFQTGATQDFYADRLGNLLTVPVTGQTLASWLGGATGYVATWYDQSSAGLNMTQATTANQPIIQKATKGPGYSCLFSGSQYLTNATYSFLNSSNYTISMVDRRGTSSTADLSIFTCGTGGTSNDGLHNIYRSGTTLLNGQYNNDINVTISAYNAGSEPVHYSFALCSSTSGRDIYIYNDPLGNPIKTQDLTKTGRLAVTAGNIGIGYWNLTGTGPYGFYIGEIFEVLVFKTSAYDTDGTTGTNVPTTVQTIYNNQFAYTG